MCCMNVSMSCSTYNIHYDVLLPESQLRKKENAFIERVWRYQKDIRIRKSEDRQQWPKIKRTKIDLQNITHKTKDRVTWTPLKTRGELRCSLRVSSSCSTSGTRCYSCWKRVCVGHSFLTRLELILLICFFSLEWEHNYV